MEKWIGNQPTAGQKTIKIKYEKILSNAQHTILYPNEIVLKAVEAEFDKKSGKEVDGLLVLTDDRFIFISKYEHLFFSYHEIKNMDVRTDGKDKHEWQLTIYTGRTKQVFDDIKKNDDTQEFLDILEGKLAKQHQEFLTTVTHNFNYFLHAERLEELRQQNIKITPFLMQRDNLGFSKNGTRLLKEKHPDAELVLEGFFKDQEKKGNFIVVDKGVWLYEYDDTARKVKKIIVWHFSMFNNATVDHFAIKTEILSQEGLLVLNGSGKDFVTRLSAAGITFKLKTRKWHQKILGFRSGKWWKKTIASVVYAFSLLFVLAMMFGEDTSNPKVSTAAEKTASEVKEATTEANQTAQLAEEQRKQQEAARLAEEQRKQQEAARVAEEQRKQQEAARIAEEQRKQQEAARVAEEQRKQQEAARLAEEQRKQQAAAQATAQKQATNVSYANCTAVRAAGAAPIRRGDPGYSSKLDRDGDGIACE